MNLLRGVVTSLVVAMTGLPAGAQNAVQLPTWSSFRTQTTVTVPDRGSVYTGGINRAADGRNEFGTPLMPFGNRSFGGQRSASSVWTSVYIHDFQAMDEALLSQAARTGSSRTGAMAPGGIAASATRPLAGRSGPVPASWQPRPTPEPDAGPLGKSIAELTAERAGEQQARAAEAERLFELGKRAQVNGKPNVAKIYFQQASRRAQGPLQAEILAQLRLVTQPSVAQQ